MDCLKARQIHAAMALHWVFNRSTDRMKKPACAGFFDHV